MSRRIDELTLADEVIEVEMGLVVAKRFFRRTKRSGAAESNRRDNWLSPSE